MNSLQPIKSFDTTVRGTSLPLLKNSETENKSSSSSSSSCSKDLYSRCLVLSNLPIDLIPEYLELYLERLSDEAEIERIDYFILEDTTVMATFKTELS